MKPVTAEIVSLAGFRDEHEVAVRLRAALAPDQAQSSGGVLPPTDDKNKRIAAPLDGSGTGTLADNSADSLRVSMADAPY
jgi:hypothetical protein